MDVLALPKVELHLHFEGAIPAEVFRQLYRKYASDSSDTASEPEFALGRYRGFDEFARIWKWRNSWLREYEDFRFAAEGVAVELIRHNVRYAEIHFSPASFTKRGLDLQALATAIRSGFAARSSSSLRVKLIMDLVRDHGPALAARLVDAASEIAAGTGIVAIGLGGMETEAFPESYASVFKEAARRGFRRVVHAGEAAGADTIWRAIRNLHPERIGHALRACDDPHLLEFLRESRLPVEVCVTSNVCLGLVASVQDHPLPRYYRSGIQVVVSSDDPAMFGTDIGREFVIARDILGLSNEALLQIRQNAVGAAFLTAEERASLLDECLALAMPPPPPSATLHTHVATPAPSIASPGSGWPYR